MKIGFAIFVAVLVAIAAAAPPNNPVVAVLTKPVKEEDKSQGSFISSTVVRWLQSAGLRVIPLLYDAPVSQRENVLSQVNGVLFPGGAVWLRPGGPYYDTGKAIVDYAIKRGDAGDPFPLFGICLGYELMCIAVADSNVTVMESQKFDSSWLPLPLDFTAEAKNSKFFADIPQYLWNALASENITLNDHSCGLYPETFETNPKLKSFFRVLSTNVDRKGLRFVSTIEAKEPAKYPFFATQWHPECNAWYCSGSYAAFNTDTGVTSAFWALRAFAAAARKSTHHFSSSTVETKSLFDSDAPKFDSSNGRTTWYFPASA